jgi:pimeloyl-ACP methyl ester carboxylesterase
MKTIWRLLAAMLFVLLPAGAGYGQTQQTLMIRGHAQCLRVYGTRGGVPVIVSSGDGGWIHLGPHVADVLAARGYFVVGFDVKAYLESFTTRTGTLSADEAPADFKRLIDFAAAGTTEKPILIGVSEGAGLSLLAAAAAPAKPAVTGVIGLGVSDSNELGWRWKDAVIYLTHGAPSEPSFSAAAIADRLSPVPLALIHSTRDEYAPLADAERVFERARQPKRLWTVAASNHRFSDNLAAFDRTLLDAVEWVRRARAQ